MTTRSQRLGRVSIAVLLALAIHPTGSAQGPRDTREPLPAAAPASVGFSEERLSRLDAHEFSRSDGFGLGVAVRVDLARSNELGSVGQFGWSGAATTTVNIDPKEQLVALVFAQHALLNQHDLFWHFNTLVYQALVDQE
jgi:CubicO group peptidase (beta-lactamase class C family)